MSRPKGLLSLEELAEGVREGEIDTVLVMFADLYGRLMGKRCDAEFFLEQVAKNGTHGCNYLLTVDMEMNPVEGYEFANWNSGYGDVHLVPDLATLRRASWLDASALVLCHVEDAESRQLASPAPRTVLQRQVEKLAERGLSALAASELEFYVFETTYKEAARKSYEGLQPSGWYLEDYHMLHGGRHERLNANVRRHLKSSGIPVETTKGEWGLGQHEVNIRYAEVSDMADRHVLLKQCVKEVAEAAELSVTFMAKVREDWAGSSCHLHLSLSQDGKNAFCGEESLSGIRCSKIFRWFLAGWIAHVHDVMVFYAPTVNSYKRYRSASWAPTRLAWSRDNRTAGFRIVGEGESLRIECRIPGADCNPYLAFAAALASGFDGIARKMEPPPLFEGDAYAAGDLARVPETLSDALEAFRSSAFAKQAFGDEVVGHYGHFFECEQRDYDRAVTDWERRRYFERI